MHLYSLFIESSLGFWKNNPSNIWIPFLISQIFTLFRVPLSLNFLPMPNNVHITLFVNITCNCVFLDCRDFTWNMATWKECHAKGRATHLWPLAYYSTYVIPKFQGLQIAFIRAGTFASVPFKVFWIWYGTSHLISLRINAKRNHLR